MRPQLLYFLGYDLKYIIIYSLQHVSINLREVCRPMIAKQCEPGLWAEQNIPGDIQIPHQTPAASRLGWLCPSIFANILQYYNTNGNSDSSRLRFAKWSKCRIAKFLLTSAAAVGSYLWRVYIYRSHVCRILHMDQNFAILRILNYREFSAIREGKLINRRGPEWKTGASRSLCESFKKCYMDRFVIITVNCWVMEESFVSPSSPSL